MCIDDIRYAVNTGVPIEYSIHCQQRMLERGISRADIMYCINNGEIIEENPLSDTNTSKESLPSCLIIGYRYSDKRPIHIVVGYNGLIYESIRVSPC